MSKQDLAAAVAKGKLALAYMGDMAQAAALKAGDVDGDGHLTMKDIELAHAKAEEHAALFVHKTTPLNAIVIACVASAAVGWFARVGWVALKTWWA